MKINFIIQMISNKMMFNYFNNFYYFYFLRMMKFQIGDSIFFWTFIIISNVYFYNCFLLFIQLNYSNYFLKIINLSNVISFSITKCLNNQDKIFINISYIKLILTFNNNLLN